MQPTANVSQRNRTPSIFHKHAHIQRQHANPLGRPILILKTKLRSNIDERIKGRFLAACKGYSAASTSNAEEDRHVEKNACNWLLWHYIYVRKKIVNTLRSYGNKSKEKDLTPSLNNSNNKTFIGCISFFSEMISSPPSKDREEMGVQIIWFFGKEYLNC